MNTTTSPTELPATPCSPLKGRKLKKPSKEAVTFEAGGGWGDAIGYSEYPYRVHGWKQRKPVKGDVLTTQMKSGKMLVSIFQQIDRCGDPPDMFFAVVEPIGYSDEVNFTLPEKHVHRGYWL